MIVTAVVLPHPPLLLRELCGLHDIAPELRAACRQALGSVLEPAPDAVVVVGGAATGREWDPALPVGVGRFGTTRAADAVSLPHSLGVARRLLDEAGWAGPVRMHTVAWDADRDTVAERARAVAAGTDRAVLLVMGDGTARRGEKAPGHLDDRAFAFDDEIGRALADGDPEALAGLDPALGGELLAQGRAALAVLGEVVAAQPDRPSPSVRYRDDPFGVMYTVAVWELASPVPPA